MSHSLKYIFVIMLVLSTITSCTLAGLDLQQDVTYVHQPLNPKMNKTVLEFIRSRPDLFTSMNEAIEYAGLDTLYQKEGNTYILMTDAALSNLDNATAYFKVNYFLDPINPALKVYAGSWYNYPVEQVREFLKYHVVKGTYNYKQLTATRVWANTYATPDSCKMSFVLVNDRYANMNFQSNKGYSTSLKTWTFEIILPRTAGLECTNSGAVHVLDRYILPPSKVQLAN